MSENTQKKEKEGGSVSGNAVSRDVIAQMLSNNFINLPVIDQKLFLYGHMYLGVNAGLAGLISNSLFRRALHVRHGAFTSALPMAVLPFMTTYALYNAIVSNPLLTGDLNCSSCALLRGALVGLVGGAVYPVLMALPVNLALAAKYNTAPMPEKGNLIRFWVDLTRPIARKMMVVVPLQAFFGAYLGSRHFKSYTLLAQLTFGSRGEELKY